jgi:hypothetical protein
LQVMEVSGDGKSPVEVIAMGVGIGAWSALKRGHLAVCRLAMHTWKECRHYRAPDHVAEHFFADVKPCVTALQSEGLRGIHNDVFNPLRGFLPCELS